MTITLFFIDVVKSRKETNMYPNLNPNMITNTNARQICVKIHTYFIISFDI